MPSNRNRETISVGINSLYQFCSVNMYHDEFKNPEKSALKWSKTALTRACNSPESLSLAKIKELSVFFFGSEKQASYFIEQFGAGRSTITIDEAEQLAQ